MKYLVAIIFLFASCSSPTTQEQPVSDSVTVSGERLSTTDDTKPDGVRYLDKIYRQDQIGTRVHEYAPGLQLTSYFVKPPIDTTKDKPVIIFLHGGGGDMNSTVCVNYCNYFARLGYSALSMNYVSENPITKSFPPEMQREAVYSEWSCLQWVRDNTSEGHVDGTKIFVMGSSAGAVTALQSAVASWNQTDSYFSGWERHPNNLKYPVTVLGTATISGAAAGIYERLLSNSQTPNAFFTGGRDTKIPTKNQVANFNKMVSSRVPHMNEDLWEQTIFTDADHTLENFDSVSHKITLQFFSLLKSTSL